MPRGDGTPRGSSGQAGPAGEGPGTGRGMGGGGRGRMGGFGLGAVGSCVCLNCGKKASHQRGVPCYQVKCPNCGSNMTRAR